MPDTRTIGERCQATTKTGSQCNAKPRPNRPYCLWHDPEAEDTRREISRRGGQARSNQARALKAMPTEPLTTEELRGWLSLVFVDVVHERKPPGIGTAAATIAKVMMEITRTSDLEERITVLEQERERRRPA